MMTTTRTYQDEMPFDEGGIEASRDLPLLLTLVEQSEDEQQEPSRLTILASAVNRTVEQRLPGVAAAFLAGAEEAGGERGFADRACAELTALLQQGFRRLLLVPWGGRRMGSLLGPVRRALGAASGEPASLTELALPQVHVDGVLARGAFGGYSSIQAQLSPLMEAFPGWDRTWYRLSAGDARIVLLRTSEWTDHSLQNAAWEKPTIKALTAALDPQRAGFMTASERARWQSDGEIYARYLASLLCAAVDFLARE